MNLSYCNRQRVDRQRIVQRPAILLIAVWLLWWTAAPAAAGIREYRPNDRDLDDLSHGSYYAWNIGIEVPEGETIVAASLTFRNIYNWSASEPFDLWVHQLDYIQYTSRYYGTVMYTGEDDGRVFEMSDNTGGQNDAFTDSYHGRYSFGDTTLLAHWDETGDTPYMPAGSGNAADVTYAFTDTDLAQLAELMDMNTFGLGFDPDCHFYNTEVMLSVETQAPPGPEQPVPEPGTLLLVGFGLAVAAWRRRRDVLSHR